MDRDVNARHQGAGHEDGRSEYRWRSKEIARQQALEVSGVLEAARRFRGPGLRNTLGICMIALAVIGGMVALGLMRETSSPSAEAPPLISEVSSVAFAGGAGSNAGEEMLRNFALAGLVDNESPTPEPEVEPNRADCESIRGTSYLSDTERLWFLTHCVGEPEPVTEPFAFTSSAGAGGVPTAEPAPQPEPVQGITTGDVIATGANYIASQPGPSYDVAYEGCNASQVGGVWLVTCQTTLTGCSLAECTTWEAVCVVATGDAMLSTETC